MDRPQSIDGLRVLVLEDDPILAAALADVLGELGCGVLGPFAQNRHALNALSDPSINPQVGILDVHLGAETCDRTAREFERRNWPFIFMSGVAEAAILPEWLDRPHLVKPFGVGEIEKVLRLALAGAGSEPEG